jgi:hypothetical protein
MTKFERTGGQTGLHCRVTKHQERTNSWDKALREWKLRTRQLIRNATTRHCLWQTLLDLSLTCPRYISHSLFLCMGGRLHQMMILIHTVWTALRTGHERIYTKSDLMRYVGSFNRRFKLYANHTVAWDAFATIHIWMTTEWGRRQLTLVCVQV